MNFFLYHSLNVSITILKDRSCNCVYRVYPSYRDHPGCAFTGVCVKLEMDWLKMALWELRTLMFVVYHLSIHVALSSFFCLQMQVIRYIELSTSVCNVATLPQLFSLCFLSSMMPLFKNTLHCILFYFVSLFSFFFFRGFFIFMSFFFFLFVFLVLSLVLWCAYHLLLIFWNNVTDENEVHSRFQGLAFSLHNLSW